MVDLIRITVPPPHTQDWLDLCAGESVNVEGEPDTQAIVIKQGITTMVLDVGPEALADLISRADFYVAEEFEDSRERMLQASARATLRRLAKDGHARQVPGHGPWVSTHGGEA